MTALVHASPRGRTRAPLLLEPLEDRLLPASYYVGPLGSDSLGDGSLSKPCATLAQATAAIPDDGSEAVFLDGSYAPQSIPRDFTQHVTDPAPHPSLDHC